MRLLILFAFALGLAGSASSQTKEPKVVRQYVPNTALKWKEYAFPTDGFAIQLPFPPNPPHQDSNLPGTTVYSVSFSQVSGVSIRAKVAGDDCDNQLKETVQNVAKQMGGAKPREISVEGRTAYERYDDHNGHKDYTRLWCSGSRLFVGSLRWPPMEQPPSEGFRVLNSFRTLSQRQ